MLKVRSIGRNMTEIETSKACILVSYETPVAAMIDGSFYRTSKFWSVTTSKHINQWINGAQAEQKPQEFFNNLLEG